MGVVSYINVALVPDRLTTLRCLCCVQMESIFSYLLLFSQLHFSRALCTVYPHFHLMHGELLRKKLSPFFTHFCKTYLLLAGSAPGLSLHQMCGLRHEIGNLEDLYDTSD